MHKEAMGNINEWLIAHTETQGKDQVQHEKAEDGQANKGGGHKNDDDDLGSGMRVLV